MKALPASVERYLHFSESRYVDLIDRCDALLQGHFRLLSGKHSEYFLRFSHIGRDTRAIAAVAHGLMQALPAFDAVLAPETAGIFLASSLAQQGGAHLVVVQADIQRRPTSIVRRGDARNLGRTLVVNDVVTSNRSLLALNRFVASVGGEVVASAAFLRHETAPVMSSLSVLGVARWPLYERAICPMCEKREEWIWGGELS